MACFKGIPRFQSRVAGNMMMILNLCTVCPFCLCLVSAALTHLSDTKLPKDEALRLLRVEMQRCLGSLKGKRQRISQLQEELQLCQGQVHELQTQLDEAKLTSSVRT